MASKIPEILYAIGSQLDAFMYVEILLKYFRRKLLQSEWSKTVSNLGMSRFIQTFQPPSHANLEALKKSPEKPGDKDLKPGHFKNMHEMKPTTTDYLFQSILYLISTLCCTVTMSWHPKPWVSRSNREGWKVYLSLTEQSCFFYKTFTSLHSKFHCICKRFTAFP